MEYLAYQTILQPNLNMLAYFLITSRHGPGLLIFLLVFLSLFVGCNTDTGNLVKDRNGRVTNAVLKDVFNTVLQAGLSYGTASLSGQNGQDAAEAAFISAGESNGVNMIGDIMTAYAGPQVAPITNAALSALKQANPQTPAEKAAVLNTIGAAIQTAANQKF